MNIAPYVPLAGFFINVFFALFVFSRGTRSPANRVYLLLGLSIAIWNLGSYHLFIVRTHDEALYWARFLQFGCIFGVVAFFHLALIVAGFSVWRWIRWLYCFEFVLAATNFTPLFIKDVRWLGESGWYAVAGPAFHVFNVPFTLMFCSIFVLVKKMGTVPRMQRKRLVPLICAQSMLAVLGTNDVLPIIGVDHYPFTNIQVYPWGSLAAVFYGIITAYSVIQHDLLDIQSGFSRYAAHFIRFAFLFSITLGLLFVVQLVTKAFNGVSLVGSMLVFLLSSLIASLLFPRLLGGEGLEKWERRILGDRFEYQDRVHNFIESMSWYGDVESLLSELHDVFTKLFRLRGYQIILRDVATRTFTLYRAYPEEPQRPIPELKVPSAVFRYFEWGKASHLALNTSYPRPSSAVIEQQARNELAGFPGEFCFPLMSEEEMFGLLLVGSKESGDPFTSTDLHLFEALVKNISLMVNQIRLKDQILRTQELDLLGRMSQGMAHDLNNLLTPIWTLLQLASEGLVREALDHELLAVALRNIKTVRAYIKEALFFSENLRPDLSLGRLDMLITQTVDLARAGRRKAFEIEAVTPGEVLVEMDDVLIQRLLANLISNACDASQPGGIVRVVLERLAKTETARDWLRLKVIDHGEGIPKENLERVLTPYFTTKNRGDEGRGFGLGLAICRKIVALHDGHLSITSQLGEGTTVQIDLPSRQLKFALTATASAA